MRTRMITALTAHYQGEIAKHKMNVEAFFNNPVGVGEHIDIMETISAEIGKIAEFEDKLAMLELHFVPAERVKI
jgi:hypothetical protein